MLGNETPRCISTTQVMRPYFAYIVHHRWTRSNVPDERRLVRTKNHLILRTTFSSNGIMFRLRATKVYHM